jgi:chromosome segregation ATPase
LPEQLARPPRAATEVRSVELLPSLAAASSPRLADSQSWLTGLVRSLEHRRGELAAKVEAYGARLVQLAHAEMLDVEPRLHAALGDALIAQLEVAIEQQVAWLESELARVRAAIDKERAALASVVQQRAEIRRELDRLTAAIKSVEEARPALSQAAAATPAIGSAAT